MAPTRRNILQSMGAMTAATVVAPTSFAAAAPITRPIPSSGERLPVVGLGSWITFNVGRDKRLLDESAAVIAAFFAAGGRMIDSSPMYGSSQATIGYGLRKLGGSAPVFSADKVWTSSPSRGPAQIEQSRSAWGVPRFDLLEVHNLLSWERHLDTLASMKADGKLRYIGVTTSHGRRHGDLARIMETRPLDFIQLTYNALDREAEARLLPLARERGIAVIVNRPYQRGDLIDHVKRHPLPKWAAETGAQSWPQFLLRFIISHPAVTCAIPATTRVEHVRENLAAATTPLPDQKLRQRMAAYVAGL